MPSTLYDGSRIAHSSVPRIRVARRAFCRHRRQIGLGRVPIGLYQVTSPSRSGPDEHTGTRLQQAPARQLLDLVMRPAAATEIAGTRPAALVPGQGVVKVSSPGRLTARAEAAGQVPGGHELPEARRWPVRGRCSCVGTTTVTGARSGHALGVQPGNCPHRGVLRHGYDLANWQGTACVRRRLRGEPGFSDGNGDPAHDARLGGRASLSAWASAGTRMPGWPRALDCDGAAVAIGENDSPFGLRAARCQDKELLCLQTRDWPDAADPRGLRRLTSKRRPRNEDIEQPGWRSRRSLSVGWRRGATGHLGGQRRPVG